MSRDGVALGAAFGLNTFPLHLTGLLLLQPLPNQSTMLFIMSRSVAQGRGCRRHIIVIPGEGSIEGLPTQRLCSSHNTLIGCAKTYEHLWQRLFFELLIVI